MRCQVSPLFVIIMIVLVGRYCYGYSVTIWNGDSDADFAVPHQILQRFRVHARLCLIAAISMAADVRRDYLLFFSSGIFSLYFAAAFTFCIRFFL